MSVEPNSVDSPRATKGAAAALTAAPFPWQQALLSLLATLGPIFARWLIATIESNAGAPAAADPAQNPPT